jgi:hypothetical protein
MSFTVQTMIERCAPRDGYCCLQKILKYHREVKNDEKNRLHLIQHSIYIILTLGVALAQTDIQGSKDRPLIARVPGYYISQYNVSEFAAFDSTVIGGKDIHWEGKVYSYGYSREDVGRPISMLQIVRNYVAAINRVGGKIQERPVQRETTGICASAQNQSRYRAFSGLHFRAAYCQTAEGQPGPDRDPLQRIQRL